MCILGVPVQKEYLQKFKVYPKAIQITKSLPRRDNSLSLGRGLWNKKGEAGGKSRVKPSNIFYDS